jgi:hypothetical protein
VANRTTRRAAARRVQESPIDANSADKSSLTPPAELTSIPASYQALTEYYQSQGSNFPLHVLRLETMRRIERITNRPLLCYVTQTSNVSPGVPSSIDHSDLTGFSDLVQSVDGDAADLVIISNGGSPEAAERIVRLLRGRFASIRLVVPANAYSAATLIGFSADEILMTSAGTLGPIDPQINGVPARAILRAFERVEARLKAEGPQALTAYMPLLAKYDLHLLELCRTGEELSKDLARRWLSSYMFKCAVDDPRVQEIVTFFSDHDVHMSHGRSIDRNLAREKGLNVQNVESIDGFAPLIRSLANQFEIFIDKTPFFKLFENAHGITWGRQAQQVTIQFPVNPQPASPQPITRPGPPQRTG